jgi:Sulfotransferase family
VQQADTNNRDGDRGASRLPDFVIIGSMKSGTTSLFEWLGALDSVYTSRTKEPHFFSREDRWPRGVGWYQSLFADAPPHSLIGEASVSYTDPARALVSAKRMAEVIPQARLIFVIRHPVERMRSHYRHEVQRSRERRPFVEALADPDNPYVRVSSYYQALLPFWQYFSAHQILVIRMEDLVGDPHPAWWSVLSHLGLPRVPRPEGIYNVTESKSGFSSALLWLWERGLDRPFRRIPAPMRDVGRKLLMRTGPKYGALMATAEAPVPAETMRMLLYDSDQLQARLARERLWIWS